MIVAVHKAVEHGHGLVARTRVNKPIHAPFDTPHRDVNASGSACCLTGCAAIDESLLRRVNRRSTAERLYIRCVRSGIAGVERAIPLLLRLLSSSQVYPRTSRRSECACDVLRIIDVLRHVRAPQTIAVTTRRPRNPMTN